MVKKPKVTAFGKIVNKKNAYCLVLAVLLTVLNHYAVYFPWLIPEHKMIASSTEWKTKLNRLAGHRSPGIDRITSDFLIIDISQDMEINCDSLRGNSIGLPADHNSFKSAPCNAIPDLRKITRLFQWLSAHPDEYNVVVCDLLFDRMPKTKETDSLLGHLVNMLQHGPETKIIFAGLYDSYEKRFPPSYFSGNIPDIHKGAVNEELTSNHFFKYRLSYDHGKVKTLPLLMLERIDHYRIKHGSLGFDKYINERGFEIFIR
ncbi:MAG TPA: hypothetical protein VGO58_09925 [Chitinophagaceae bacterium]|jgi:hypothetical protein|nr:hypothetical protein [Chitinophagaceae bacterium]